MKVVKIWLLATAISGVFGVSLHYAVADIAPAGPAAVSAEAGLDEDAPRSSEHAVSDHVETLVRDASLAHLQTMGIRDQGLSVLAQPELDALGKIIALRVKLTITTDIDRQEQIGREVRQAVQRALIDDGYRFELPGVDAQALPAEILARPLATLNLQVEYPVQTTAWYERLSLRPLLVLVAILLLAMIGFYICWLMTGRLWRSLFAEPAKQSRQSSEPTVRAGTSNSADVGGLPPLPDAARSSSPNLDVPPPPVHIPATAATEILPTIPLPTTMQ